MTVEELKQRMQPRELFQWDEFFAQQKLAQQQQE